MKHPSTHMIYNNQIHADSTEWFPFLGLQLKLVLKISTSTYQSLAQS